MRSGNQRPGSPSTRRRAAFRPISESLEDRKLMAVLDLTNTAAASLGVQEVGATTNSGAGYSVADVGDVTGSGYDSFLVSAPSITAPTGTGVPTGAGTSTVYLVLGSKQFSNTNFDWFRLNANQRVGDLATLGTANQVNPAIIPPTGNASVGFDFDGITFTSNSAANSLLGASVAGLGDINNDGFDDFAIGAPNYGAGGRAFIIYGGSQLTTTKSIDLSPTTNGPTKTVSFFSNTAGDQVGFSVAGIGRFLSQGTTSYDVGIGAPGTNGTSGAAYAISGTSLNGLGSGASINVTTIGLAGGVGAQFSGQAGDRAGASISTGGNFDGATDTNSNRIDSLLIGAPGAIPTTGNFSAGTGYLIYGSQPTTGTTAVGLGIGTTFSLANVGAAVTTALPNPINGLTLRGIATGRLGFAVNSAGDFKGLGTSDIMLGAPGGTNTTGFVAIVQGSSTTAARPNGVFNIDPIASSALTTTYLVGEQTGDLAGYSLAPITRYNGRINGIIGGIVVGAPGFAGNLGAAYIIRRTFGGGASVVSLAGVATAPRSTRVTATNSLAGNPPALGASVSSHPLFATRQGPTAFGLGVDDVILGAPGYSLVNPSATSTSSRPLAGTVYALSGLKYLDDINPEIAIEGTNPPFAISSNGNNPLTFYVESTLATPTQPAFAPFTQIAQNQPIYINGVQVTISNFSSVNDINGDGVPEASFTVPRSSFTLPAGTSVSFLIAGSTTGNLPFVGSAVAAVGGNSGGGGGGGGGGTTTQFSLPLSSALFAPRTFFGTTGGELVPAVQTLEHLNSYQPLPAAVAYNQFLAAPGFKVREAHIYGPNGRKRHPTVHEFPAGTAFRDKYYDFHSLPHKVFTRGKFKKGESITFTHPVRVIPRNRQTDTYKSF